MSNSSRNLANRVEYLDILRIMSTFAVLFTHVAINYWESVEIGQYSWNIFTIYGSIGRWCIPIFVMISGTLLLRKEISVKKIYSKYCLRMIISYMVWSLVYFLFASYTQTPAQQLQIIKQGGIGQLFTVCFTGYFHMWYIPMTIGLYICTPFFKQIVNNKKVMEYYIVLSGIVAFVFPQIMAMVGDFGSEGLFSYLRLIDTFISSCYLNIASAFSCFFVLGYYLTNYELKRITRVILYILGIIGFVATIVLTYEASCKQGVCVQTYFANTRLNLFVQSVAIFVLFKQMKITLPATVSKKLGGLSNLGFGVYLVHILVIGYLGKVGIDALSFNPLYAVPIVALLVFVISSIISFILSKVPILNKYVV